MTSMPEQVQKEMSVILAKYGMIDTVEQGKTCIEIGEMLRGVAKKAGLGKSSRALSAQVRNNLLLILSRHGIKDRENQARCSLDIVDFVNDLVKAAKEG